MKKIFTIFCTFFLFSSVSAQKVSKQLIAEYEDTLKIMAHTIMNTETEQEKFVANRAFIKTLKEVLQYERSFDYPFDSLKTISIKTSSDNRVRIYTWILKKDNGTYQYFGFVHYKNKSKKRYEIIALNDNSENIRRPKNEQLDNENWYGALYYEIIYIKKKGRKYYTLLGWDGNNDVSTKKIIDVMYFSGKEIIKYGAQISAGSGRIIEQIVRFIGKEDIEINNKQYSTLKFNFFSSDPSLSEDKKLNMNIWYDENNLIWLKASFKKNGDWEYRLKYFD